MNFIKTAVLLCAVGASLTLTGCDSAASSQDEIRKGIRENTVNAFPLGDTPSDKPNPGSKSKK
ncbi:MAG: hypothetical protein EPN61_05630 [Burkholderiaceae bacterium]|nr:MAG: hypothetical protein EPN61_05630 [Burkholderiaceae bacterium]